MKSVPPCGSGWVSVEFRSIIRVRQVISLTGYPRAYWATFLAGPFAYKRKIALHRQWATRSYAIALVFIAGRFVMGVTGWEALGVEIVQAIIWSCLALSVVFADISIHWKETRSVLTVPAKSGAARNDSLPKNAVGAT